MRETGTTVIIEDVAFPVPRLAEATRDLHRIFHQHDYDEAVIWGHALEGNLHLSAPTGTPMANAYVTLLQALGHDVEGFGDSTGEFALSGSDTVLSSA